jgi:diketogulonate reductase-like aldo/keto reductase
MHLYMQNEALVRYCARRGIIVTGWGSVGQGGRLPVLDDPVAKEIAAEVGKSVSAVVIKFLLQLGENVVALAKSISPEHIRANADLEFELNVEQIERLRKRERAQRLTNKLELWGCDVFGDNW